jgi:hypothetical protein
MRLRLSGLILLLHSVAMAQLPSSEEVLVPDQAIQVSPLHLLNFYPTVEVSFEQRILPRVTTQLEVGYVLNYDSNNGERYQNKRGVKLKLEGRFYFRRDAGENKISYGAVEPYLNAIDFDRRSVVEQCLDSDCMNRYTRQYKDRGKYREQGVSVKLGNLWYLDAKSRTFLDFNAGLTFRVIRYDLPASHEGFRVNDESGFLEVPDEANRFALSPCIALRLGYRFK